MANINFAAYVGKSFSTCNGMVKYTIVSVDGNTIDTLFTGAGRDAISVKMKAEDANKLFASGNAKWEDASTETTEDAPKSEQPKAEQPKSTKKSTKKTLKAKRVEIPEAEVIDDEDKDEHEATTEDTKDTKAEAVDDAPMADDEFSKLMQSINNICATTTDSTEDASTEDTEDTEEADAEEVEDTEEAPNTEPKSTKGTKKSSDKYVYAEYTTKRGKTAPKIMGFDGTEDTYTEAMLYGGAKSWEYAKVGGKKVKAYTVIFGSRWCEAAKQMVIQLNNGGDLDDMQEISLTYRQAMESERKAQKEEYLAKKEERAKAKAAKASTKSAESAKSAAKGAATSEKVYTKAEVEEKIRSAFAAFFGATIPDKSKVAQYMGYAEPIIKAVAA